MRAPGTGGVAPRPESKRAAALQQRATRRSPRRAAGEPRIRIGGRTMRTSSEGAADERNECPAIGAGEREQRPAGEQDERRDAPRGGLDGSFGVVVLVLVAVVARIVGTCCARNRPCSGRRPRTCGWLRLIVSIARSARRRRVISAPMTNVTPETMRREDDRVGDREHRRRVDDDPVERPVRQVREQRLHALRREQLRRIRRRLARGDRQQVRDRPCAE